VTAEGLENRQERPIALGKFTALLVAGTYGPPDLVKALLDAGAEVTSRMFGA